LSHELLKANVAFYECLESRDAGAVADILVNSPEQICIHPGREPIVGFTAVLDSWIGVFSRAEYLQFFITDEVVLADAGELGIVMCRENLLGYDRGTAPGLRPGSVVATNVFVSDGTGWHLLAHHGSVVQQKIPPR
jgi:ketosteroid isomerase-like protein